MSLKCCKYFLCPEVAGYRLFLSDPCCFCGFLTSLFGLLSVPAGCQCMIYDSLELMVQNRDLCPWCCDWTGAGSLAPSPLSVPLCFSRLLPLDMARCLVSDSGVDQHPCTPPHLSSSSRFFFFSFPPEKPGCRLAGEPTHLQTRRQDLSSPFHPSCFLIPTSWTPAYSLNPHPSLSGCEAVVGIWDQQGALYVELG